MEQEPSSPRRPAVAKGEASETPVSSENETEHLCDNAVLNKSESFYLWMCQQSETTQQVAFRRDIMDIEEMFDQLSSFPYKSRISGSFREGFRIDSDVDDMKWLEQIRVIWNSSQAESYEKHMYIYADSSESPPGYALLYLPMENNHDEDVYGQLSSVSIQMNNKLCISSSLLRLDELRSFPRGSIINEPCISERLGHLNYDHAICFASDVLPPFAVSWIERNLLWPPTDVVRRIVRNGCHFVAVGHKLRNHEDNEWRISFSLAEYELVRSMNHTQFLTYGFLKSIIHENINDKSVCAEYKMLRSYHIKTVLFWAIQQNTLHRWCPQNFLDGFWICFKLLLKWVYEGICPNFFIPENNMFLTKIHGSAQQQLFGALYSYYENGIESCLPINNALCTYTNRINENNLLSQEELDAEFFKEVEFISATSISSLDKFDIIEKSLEQLINLPLTQYQIVVLQTHVCSFLQSTAFLLHGVKMNRRTNKLTYIADKVSCQMLKLATKWGCLSDILYIVMYYYKTQRYREALSLLEKAKVKLNQPYFLYCGSAKGNPRTVEGLSLSNKMRRAVVVNISLNENIIYINELLPEQTCCFKKGFGKLRISPFVLLNMLTFLCSRHVDMIRSQRALNTLKSDVQNALEHYRRISYEILGICQEIAGNKDDALNSYYKSLEQFSSPPIQSATRQRIHDLQRSNR